MAISDRKELRQRRHLRIRKKIAGTADCPRLSVCFTAKHIYAQVIDDDCGHTLVSASSLEQGFKEQSAKANIAGAQLVGRLVAEKAKQAGIEKVVFDRGGFKYHGRVKALADAARETGLKC